MRKSRRFFDEMKNRLDQFPALDYQQEANHREVEVITPKNVTKGREDFQ